MFNQRKFNGFKAQKLYLGWYGLTESSIYVNFTRKYIKKYYNNNVK